MNNAFIIYDVRPNPGNQERSTKSDYLMEVAYNMCRPWAVQRYRNLGNMQITIRQMLDTTFVLTPAERGEVLQPPPQGNIDQQPQIDEQPHPQAAHPPWLPLVVPDAVPGAHRDDPKFVPRPNEHQFLGGRWLDSTRQICKMCPARRNWSGKARCESLACGHRPICNHHSVILCQTCVYPH